MHTYKKLILQFSKMSFFILRIFTKIKIAENRIFDFFSEPRSNIEISIIFNKNKKNSNYA
jgi:hypothetical protein